MPPQPTDGASHTGSVAGKLRLDLSDLTGHISRGWRTLAAVWQGSRGHAAVHDLRDKDLADIGLTRDEVERLSPDRAVDRMRTRAADLWSRSGL